MSDERIYDQHRAWSDQEIEDAFHYHAPSETGVARHSALSVLFTDLCKAVDALIPNGREKALVKTKLEEAKMHASAAVARNPSTR